MDKHNVVYPYNTTIGYSATKRNEVLIHATTWMNLENIMLTKKSHPQNTPYYYMIVFIENIQNRQMHR